VKVGRVVGTIVSTINNEIFEDRKLLVCDVFDAGGEPEGYTIAVDVVDAGVGETVLILDEGNSARQILGREWGAIRAVVVGVVDDWYAS
jgi:ethanolamine utilization protein EutN